jgi:hypothetical protein
MAEWTMNTDEQGQLLHFQDPPNEYSNKENLMRPQYCSGDINNESGSLFQKTVKSFVQFPCSLVFETTATHPVSQAAINCMDTMSTLLGPIRSREGFYGAGGGPVHLFYLGKFDPPINSPGDIFPDLVTLLDDVMHITPIMLPPFSWVSSVDVCHQHLFPRTANEVNQARDDFLRLVYEALDAAGNVLQMPFAIPDITTEQFPFLVKPYLLFVQPYFRMFHSGNCPPGCPKDISMTAEIVGATIPDDEALSESPTFAFWRLESGEIMALCYWDYIG